MFRAGSVLLRDNRLNGLTGFDGWISEEAEGQARRHRDLSWRKAGSHDDFSFMYD